jgi:hypothetical protein
MVDSGRCRRSVMRLEVAMNEARVMPVVRLRNVDVLLRQDGECEHCPYGEHRGELSTSRTRHY